MCLERMMAVEQLELYELLDHLDDIAIIERDIATLTYGQVIVTNTITVRQYKFFELETEDFHEAFHTIEQLLTFIRQYC